MSARRICSQPCRDAWVEFLGIWDNGRGFADIRKLWLERAYGLGERVAIQNGAVTVEGTFDTLDEAGCLIVRTADGKRVPITAGEVYFGSAGFGEGLLMARPDELTFAPLGGVGEIGMNLSIYGLGNRHAALLARGRSRRLLRRRRASARAST